MDIPDEYWTTEVPAETGFYAVKWLDGSFTAYHKQTQSLPEDNSVYFRFCRLAPAMEVERLKARVQELESMANDSNAFIAYMQSELAAMPCLHEGTQHTGGPPMMWPEKIKCIVARAVQDVKAENEKLRGWVSVKDAMPEDGEWVLHAYLGFRGPCYGRYENGQFWSGLGHKSEPANYWLGVPPMPRFEGGAE